MSENFNEKERAGWCTTPPGRGKWGSVYHHKWNRASENQQKHGSCTPPREEQVWCIHQVGNRAGVPHKEQNKDSTKKRKELVDSTRKRIIPLRTMKEGTRAHEIH